MAVRNLFLLKIISLEVKAGVLTARGQRRKYRYYMIVTRTDLDVPAQQWRTY